MENKLHFIPVVPMRGVMVFPGMNLNFDAGREMSIKGLANASEENSLVFLVAQKDVEKEKPKLEDLYNCLKNETNEIIMEKLVKQ